MIDLATLMLIYRRPDATAKCLAAIRQARPSRLYIAADGPKTTAEDQACRDARAVTETIDWPCTVKRLYRDNNLGPRLGVETAIDWFFEHEAEGIILEDDCVAGADFFPYCGHLLDLYRHNDDVMLISGDRSFGQASSAGYSYTFSRCPLIWGWATWRSAWQRYSFDQFCCGDWQADLQSAGLPSAFVQQRLQAYSALRDGRLEAWDYVWSYAVFRQRGLCCIPRVNLITNVGMGPDATHTHNTGSPRFNVPTQVIPRPFFDPPSVAADRRTDRLISIHVHGAHPW